MRISVTVLIISLLILGGCTAKPPPSPALIQPPDSQPAVAPPAANISSAEPAQTPEPAPNPAPIPIPPPNPVTEPMPGPNEIWIVGNAFVPDVIKVSEGVSFSLTNKNSNTETVLPSPSGSNGAVYQDPKTNLFTINGANFDSVLAPGRSTTVTLVTGGAFIFYLERDPNVIASVLVGF